jgi:acid phosphatase
VRLILVGAIAAVLAFPGVAAAQHRHGSHGHLGKGVKRIVVIYEENHSFDNLYGGWEGVNGRANADAAHTTQVNQAGTPYTCLLQDDVNLATPPQPATCTDTTTATSFQSNFPNSPFQIDTPGRIPMTAKTCPAPGVFAANGVLDPTGLPGGCTRDLVHRYYQEQYQLDGGKQDRYVTGSDAAGLTMGYYDTAALPIYKYLHSPGHPSYAIADDFFQSAFGGSFLNHQWLVAAATPTWSGAVNDGSATDLHSVVDANGMPTTNNHNPANNPAPLYNSPLAAGLADGALTASCNPPAGRPPTPAGVACGDFAVNTIQPTYQPFSPGTADARKLPPQTAPTIGDRLSAKGVDWAWYSGGWSNADGDVNAPGWTNGTAPAAPTATNPKPCPDPAAFATATWPNCPDKLFQFHHQPLNYFTSFAPGTAARAAHLRDEAEFEALAKGSKKHCALKPVSFIKPIGAENEHPGYTNVGEGSGHLVELLQAIEGSRCAKNTMVVVTYDEFGGQWDHVPPPGQGGTPGAHDKWGPGTRIPALVVSPRLRGDFVVDHTPHDTTSILATIEHRFGLAPLTSRDAAVKDLSSVFAAKSPRHSGYPGRGDRSHHGSGPKRQHGQRD